MNGAYDDPAVQRAIREHIAEEEIYTGPPCTVEGCSEPTVFVRIAAPGTGCGNECRAGHYDGTCRELTPEEVI